MIYISLGSNLGDRLTYLERAIQLIKERYIADLQCSIILETQALLLPNSPKEWDIPFLNAIAYGNCNLDPRHLLHGLQQIELELGRDLKRDKWAPRVIDLDIILWDNKIINESNLKIPHLELINRPFLMHLLALINPSIKHPITNECFSNLVENGFKVDKSMVFNPKLVGIINLTSDSFSDGGSYIKKEEALKRIIELKDSGTRVIELGAQSTRPLAKIIPEEEEYNKIESVLKNIPKEIYESINISIDSFNPVIISKLLEKYKISWINDVSGQLDDETLKLIVKKGCSIVSMHSIGVPPKKEVTIPSEQNPIEFLKTWQSTHLQHLKNIGFKPEKIILDPGIGFGKNIYQNIDILRNIKQLKNLEEVKILVGHSRKSYMNAFCNKPAPLRDLETIAVSQFLMDAQVDFIRVHNVEAHQQFFVANQTIHGATHA